MTQVATRIQRLVFQGHGTGLPHGMHMMHAITTVIVCLSHVFFTEYFSYILIAYALMVYVGMLRLVAIACKWHRRFVESEAQLHALEQRVTRRD